jgi:hypothetical protein
MTKLEEILESYPEEEFLKADGFDNAIVGVEIYSNRLVYSAQKAIEILVNEEGMLEEDAIEHLYYNVIGSYVGPETPLWIDTL